MAAGMTRKAVDTVVTGEISAAAAKGLAGMINGVAVIGEADKEAGAVGEIAAVRDGSSVATSAVGE
jgi:hypothetical protein